MIKNGWEFEKYVTALNFSHRVAMYRFQCRSDYLPISHSRFTDDTLVDVDCLCPFRHGQIVEEHIIFYFEGFV